MDSLISFTVAAAVLLHFVPGGLGMGIICEPSWVSNNSTGYCYNFVNTTASWFVARKRCHDMGAQLVSIHSLDEQRFIEGRLSGYVRSALWIGLNDLQTGVGFHWDDGSGLGYLNWSPGEPNNYGNKEHCAEIVDFGPTLGKWNDIFCTQQSGYICKKRRMGYIPPRSTTHAPAPSAKVYGCQDSWISYKGSCYLMMRNTTGIGWNVSEDQCGMDGAHLASIVDENEQNFIFSQLPNTASNYQDEYWLGLNDIHHQMAFEWTDSAPVTFTSWAEGEPNNRQWQDCVTISKQTGRWKDVACDNPRTGYICKRPQTPVPTTLSTDGVSTGCTRAFSVGYGYKCYTFSTSPLAWPDALSACEHVGSTLAVIPNRWEQAFLASQVAVMSGYFWVGLTNTDNDQLEWAGVNATVDFTAWSANHTGNENDTCVAMRTTTPGAGLWVNMNCSSSVNYICEYPRSGFSTPYVPTTTTTIPPVCPPSWHKYNGYCYQSYSARTDQLSFFDARDQCRGMGACLISLQSAAEEQFAFSYTVTSSSSRQTYWIGLNDLDVEMGYKWTDGTPFTYNNWGYKEPNDASGTDDCVERGSYRWNDNNCYIPHAYICKIPLGKSLTTQPSKAPTLHPPCGSSSGWRVYNGSCYYASGTATATWYDARAYCMMNGGDLASAHTEQENGFILGTMALTSSRTSWLGANDMGTNQFGWSDGSLWDYDKWSTNEPNDAFGSENCAQIHENNGYWNDQNCNENYNYVCKKPLGETSPITVPPTPLSPGNCPPSFTRVPNENTCYGIFGRTNGGGTYSSAVANCTGMGKPGEYNIATIGSRTALAQLMVMVDGLWANNTAIWIGLNDIDKSYKYTWQDNTPLALTNWGKGQPGSRYSSNSRCVVMNTGARKAGKWSTTGCKGVHPYVCATTPLTSYPTIPPSRDCVIPGYVSNGQNCYKLHQLPLSWQQAAAACRKDHANLASILSVYEQAYVDVQTLYIGTPVWIGLGDTKSTGTYTWVDTWPVYYSRWARGEPSYTQGSGCVAIQGGYWNDTVCNNKHAFLCKSTYVTPPIPSAYPSGRCKVTTWKQFGSSCYFLSLNRKSSWAEAEYDCRNRGMELASIHDNHEEAFILGLVDKDTTVNANVWIGYRRIGGHFSWSDGSSAGYVHWAQSEPAGPGTAYHKDCTELQQESGTWSITTCSTTKGYICKAPKLQASSPVSTSTESSTHIKTSLSSTTSVITSPSRTSLPHSSKTSDRRINVVNTRAPAPQKGGYTQDLSVGQIVGIITGAVLCICVVCIVLLYVKKKREHNVYSLSRQKNEALAFENISYRSENSLCSLEPSGIANGVSNGHAQELTCSDVN